MSAKNGYELSRQWFDFVECNPDEVKPVHAALYFWIVELNNKLRWIEKFGLPTIKSMQMIGIKDRRSFRKTLHDLERWEFIKIHKKSSNQYSASRISLLLIDKENLIPQRKKTGVDLIFEEEREGKHPPEVNVY